MRFEIDQAGNVRQPFGQSLDESRCGLGPALVMPHDDEKALWNGPELESAGQIAGERPRPFVGGIAVQVDVQVGVHQRQSVLADRTFMDRRVTARFHVVAKPRIAGGMMHVTGILGAQPMMQRIAVGVFNRRDAEMRVRPLRQRLRGPQGTDDSRGFVGMLRAADDHTGIRTRSVDARHRASGARVRR